MYISTKSYPYLPLGREIKYVPEDNLFMQEAMRAQKELSTDHSVSTGAVVVLENRVLGRGANQSALKSKWLIEFHKNTFCVRRFFKIPSGQKYWFCPGCASFRHHAEASALRDALSKKIDVNGADIYLYGHWWCCKSCWDSMTKAGVKNVYLVEGATEKFSK